MKIAIIGLSPTSHELAPWDDTTWEKWGLPWDAYAPRMDRLFEMHDMLLLTGIHSRRPVDYLDRLEEYENLYMQEDWLNAKAYPFDEVAKTTGYYWNSSPAYMLAMAIHEGADEIGIYGVDLTDSDEYGYQKPNMEYLIGLARGKGIKVHIPDESALCKFVSQGIKFYEHTPIYQDRYGWLGNDNS